MRHLTVYSWRCDFSYINTRHLNSHNTHAAIHLEDWWKSEPTFIIKAMLRIQRERFDNKQKGSMLVRWKSVKLGPLLVSTMGSLFCSNAYLFSSLWICNIATVVLRFRHLSMCSLRCWHVEATGLIFMLNVWPAWGFSEWPWIGLHAVIYTGLVAFSFAVKI